METKTIISIIFWALAIAFIIPGYLNGFQKLTAQKEKVSTFKNWGFSMVFMRFLGFVEIVGATLLLFPQTRLLTIPLYVVLLSGAVYTHIKHNDNRKNTLTPIIVAIHLLLMLGLTDWM